MRTTLPLIAILTLAGSLLPLSAMRAQQDTSKPGASASPSGTQATAPVEDAPAPTPTPALKTLLDSIDKKLVSKQYKAAISAADAALKAAQAANDHVGEAMAQVQRATALEGLGINKVEEAMTSWKRAAELWGQIPDGPGQVEALANASILLMSSHADQARQLIERTIMIARSETKRPLQAARELNLAAQRDYMKSQLDSAQSLAEAGLALFKKLSPDSLDVAASLNILGNVAYDRSDLKNAKNYYTSALKIREKLDPGSLVVSDSLNNLGNIALENDDLVAAENYYKRALVIRNKRASGSPKVGDSLNSLGNVANKRGDLDGAENYYKISLKIVKKISPGSPDEAAVQNNLGEIAWERGDLAVAESYYKIALRIRKSQEPGSVDVAGSLANLGNVADDRGDFATAESYLKHALKIQKQQDPNSPDMVTILNDLGAVAGDRGNDAKNQGNVSDARSNRAEAKDYFKRALKIQEKLASGSLGMADSLGNLGNVAYDSSNFSAAENALKSALKIYSTKSPGSLYVAATLHNLGNVARDRSNFTAAENAYKRALKIQEKLAPGSLEEAEILKDMSILQMKQHRPKRALPLLTRAVDIIDIQRGNLADAEVRRQLLEAHYETYAALVSTYVTLHQYANAYNTLERQRGRSLSESLFKHQHIDFHKDVSPIFLARQKHLDNQRNILFTERRSLDLNKPQDQLRYSQFNIALKEINVQQHQLENDIRKKALKYASLQYPKPIKLQDVKHILDKGTLLLEYTLDEHQSYLFTVTKSTDTKVAMPPIHCYILFISRNDLRAKINELTDSLTKKNAPRDPKVCVKLYDQLLRPAQNEIKSAQRLLFCPEKELWRIPFCALIDKHNPKDPHYADPHYLIESKPIHSIISMNVYAQLFQNRKRRSAPVPLLAFGDPAYGLTPQHPTVSNSPYHAHTVGAQTNMFSSSTVHGAPTIPSQSQFLGGPVFHRIPITRPQVKTIGVLAGPGAVVHPGSEATCRKVFQEAKSADILHFACHGLLDRLDPLASFLALAPEQGGEQFGKLAAYDVLEHLHLHADLVTLCACQTGAGKVTNAEGVIGLTRAFEYAGAQSVLATLWNIDENSASTLFCGINPLNLKRETSDDAIKHSFYGALFGCRKVLDHGKQVWKPNPKLAQSKDVALQMAQIAMIHSKQSENSDPRNWAAFTLQGDWK